MESVRLSFLGGVYQVPQQFRSGQPTGTSGEPRETVVLKGRSSHLGRPVVWPTLPPAPAADDKPVAPLMSLGSGPLGSKLTMTGPGVLFTEDPGLAAYTATLGMPVSTSAATQRLCQSNFNTALCAATSVTPAGLAAVDLASRYLSPAEVLSTNPGYYHDAAHPVNVAGVMGEVAQGMGRSPERRQFLQQVALLHDFDERLDPRNLEAPPKYGSPARVQVTLAWMDKNQEALQQRMGWTPQQFGEAQALIARTDFPFDAKPRALGTAYDGQSPQGLYHTLLGRLPSECRAAVMEDGVALSFADQVGNYVGTPEQARDTVLGLGTEIGVPGPALLKGSAQFQKSVGTDIEADRTIARDLQVDARIPTAHELEAALGSDTRRHLLENRAFFEQMAQS